MHRSRPAGEQVEVNFHVLGARNPKAPSSLEYESSRGAGPAKAASRGLGTAAAAVKHHPRRLTEVAATALISGSTMCVVQSDVQSESSSNAPLRLSRISEGNSTYTMYCVHVGSTFLFRSGQRVGPGRV